MFGRNKRKGAAAGDTERYTTDAGYAGTVTKDFARRIPCWQYRPVKYQQYKPFEEFRGEIDGYLEKLFAGEIDEENGDVLDNLVGDMARQALHHLDRQRVDHRDMIHSLYVRFEGDRAAFREQLGHLEEELKGNREEQETVSVLLKKDEYEKNVEGRK